MSFYCKRRCIQLCAISSEPLCSCPAAKPRVTAHGLLVVCVCALQHKMLVSLGNLMPTIGFYCIVVYNYCTIIVVCCLLFLFSVQLPYSRIKIKNIYDIFCSRVKHVSQCPKANIGATDPSVSGSKRGV